MRIIGIAEHGGKNLLDRGALDLLIIRSVEVDVWLNVKL